jgi:hypothetical protein
MFLCEKGSIVPARYREIFAKVPVESVPPALQRWLKMAESAE